MSNDWIEHNGGPQPVDDDVWVEIDDEFEGVYADRAGKWGWEHEKYKYRILNQHLIDAARLEGIRLGLEAAKRRAEAVTALQSGRLIAIPSLDPETIAREGLIKPARSDLPPSLSDTIAREAVLDQLTSEAQADNMGYEND